MLTKNRRVRSLLGTGCLVPLIVILCVLPTGCRGRGGLQDLGDGGVAKDAYLLGTIVRIQLAERTSDLDPEDVIDEALEAMEELGSTVSVYREDSDIHAVDNAAGSPVPVAPETFYLLTTALELYESTGGAYEPTVGPVVDAWGFYTGEHRVPSQEEIDEALDLVGADRVILDPDELTVQIPHGMRIDLEALAKGYAARRAAEVLVGHGVTSALITSGPSSIKAVGDGPGGRPWRIGLVHPRSEDEVYAVVEMGAGESISTSGDYQRYFHHDGTRYAHIIDPSSGWPARAMMTLTVITEDTVVADGLSTALFTMQPEEAIELVERTPAVSAILVTADGRVMYCQEMRDRIQLEEDRVR